MGLSITDYNIRVPKLSSISRRNFIKLAGAACSGVLGSTLLPHMNGSAGPGAASVVIYHGNRDLANVAMTFDDCYDLNLLQQWADFLDSYPDARMTFFPVGMALENAALKKPDLWKNLLAKGHEVGYHSYIHALPSSLSDSEALEDYEKWFAAATSAIGTEPRIHVARPPFGELSQSFLNMCSENDLTAVMWTRSWGMSDVNFEKEKGRAQKGDIILFHVRIQDLDNAKIALPYFLSHGFNPVTLTELYTLGRQPRDEPPPCRPNPRKVCAL